MFGPVPLRGSFWTRVVFPLVIHSGTLASCWHLFISSVILSWIEVNFLPESIYSIMAWRFPVGHFLMLFWVNLCIFAFGPSSSPSNCFLVLLIQSGFFCYVLLVAIFYSKLSLHPVAISWNVLFCLYFTLSRYLFNLPSFASTFWCISSSFFVIFFLSCYFLFVPTYYYYYYILLLATFSYQC